MAVKDVKDRWLTPEGRALAREAVSRLLSGESLDDLQLGRSADRVDLRGLWLSSKRGLPGQEGRQDWEPLLARDVSWSGIDLSRSTSPIVLQNAHVADCRFDRVGWKSWRVSQSTLDRCTFVGADLQDANLDGGNGGLQTAEVVHPVSRYSNCDFTRTRFGAHGQLGRATFEGCLFDTTGFASPMWLHGASLDGCTFRGTFRTVCFGWTGSFTGVAPLVQDVHAEAASFESLEVYAIRGSGLSVSSTQEVVGPGAAAAFVRQR